MSRRCKHCLRHFDDHPQGLCDLRVHERTCGAMGICCSCQTKAPIEQQADGVWVMQEHTAKGQNGVYWKCKEGPGTVPQAAWDGHGKPIELQPESHDATAN